MGAPFKFRVQNVRCLLDCDLVVPAGELTTVIGVNNAGKSTLLDMMARCAWSLPGQGSDPGRSFPTTWYRRTGRNYHRPRANIEVPLRAAFVDDDDLLADCDSPILAVEYAPSVVETRVGNVSAQLVPLSVDLQIDAGRRKLVLTGALPVHERPGIGEVVPVHQAREIGLELARPKQANARGSRGARTASS
jgi:energy-coupling factor transporter ATP-binding protein EcfA2